MASTSTSTSNKLVRSLQKLPENKRCFNCEVLGTNFIVPAFGIFVCTDCSGLHMKCGQRVKSISLGNYTTEEAKVLQDGGNEKAGRIYLAKWSPNTSLQKPIDKKPPRVEEWIRTIFISKQYYSEEAARDAQTSVPVKALSSILGNHIPKLQVQAAVEDKPLKPGVKLPMPGLPTIKPVAIAAPEPVPQPEPEPVPQPAADPPPAPPAAPKVDEVSLLDFGNSPVAAAAPADAWSAFDSAPGAPASTTTDAFDPFGTFGSEAAHSTISDHSASDPFGSHAAGFPQPSASAFDPFSNHAPSTAPAPQNPTPTTANAFDPFSNSAANTQPAQAAFGDSAWSPFPAGHSAPQPAAPTQSISSDQGFGLDVFHSMHQGAPSSVSNSHDFHPFPTQAAVSKAPAPGSVSSSHEFNPFPTQAAPTSAPGPGSVTSSQDFNPFPTTAQNAQPAPAAAANGKTQAKNALAELPSDLFSDSAFPPPAFPGSQPSNPPQGMMGPGGMSTGMFAPNNFGGPGAAGQPGMGHPPAAAQMGFGGHAANQFGNMQSAGGAFQPQAASFGGQQYGAGMMGPGQSPGMGMPQGMGASPWGGVGNATGAAASNGAAGGFPQPGVNSSNNMGFGNHFNGMPGPGQAGMAAGQHGTTPQGQNGAMGFGGGMNAPPQQGMGFNARQGGGFNAQQGGGFTAQQGGGFTAQQGGGFNAQQGGGFNAQQGGGFTAQQGGGFNAQQGGGFNTQQGMGYNTQQGMGFNAFGPSSGMPGRPGASQFPSTNSFGMGAGAFGASPSTAAPPAAPKDDSAFADLVGDFKKALPSHSQPYGAAPAGFHAAPAFGGPANSMTGMMGDTSGFGGYGGMQPRAPAAPAYGGGMGGASGNPFG